MFHSTASDNARPKRLLTEFLEWNRFMKNQDNGVVLVDGSSLNLAMVALISRKSVVRIQLTEDKSIREAVQKSHGLVLDALRDNRSIYGVSTGIGGSSGSRTTDFTAMGHALLQQLHIGVLSDQDDPSDMLPLSDHAASSMPESWVRGAMLIRANSLIRGHSGVRWQVIEGICALIRENITPVTPLRGSVSASGDLSPLAYIAGTLGGNPALKAYVGTRPGESKKIVPADEALKLRGLEPISFLPKEQFAIINGTSYSASVAALVLVDTVHLAMLAQVCTAMGTESLLGSAGSFVPFVHDATRPHPGQIEVAANILHLLEGSKLATPPPSENESAEEAAGYLRQDRYPLRTSPQILGPQIEDILSAVDAVTIECNSTTDNPLVENASGIIHNGGNFQAMSVTNAMEKTRHALFHVAKLLFAQCTEMMNPAMSRGLPPSLAASDPSLNFHCKGLDVAMAAYVSEIGFLASPVSTHVQSAEMHNQSVNSLALVSARATLSAVDALSMLIASYIYALCQALDLRALLAEFAVQVSDIIKDEVSARFSQVASPQVTDKFCAQLRASVSTSMQATSSMDLDARMDKVSSDLAPTIVQFLSQHTSPTSDRLAVVTHLQASLATKLINSYRALQEKYLLNPQNPAPASAYLGRTRAMYEFVRVTLGISIHGKENYNMFGGGGDAPTRTIGQEISRIYQSIRDGKMSSVFDVMFA